MKFALAVLSALLISAPAFGQNLNLPKNFDAQKWQQLKDKLLRDGDYKYIPKTWIFSFSHVIPNDETKSRTADYLTEAVNVDPDGDYHIMQVNIISEKWTILANGNRDINQWIFWMSPEGSLYQIGHYHLVETPQKDVMADEELPTGNVSDPANLARFGQKLNEWYKVLQPATSIVVP